MTVRAIAAGWAIALALLAAGAGAQPAPAVETLSHGRFKDVALLKPAGTPKQVVLWLSGDDGWDAGSAALARSLADAGALVLGIDLPRFFAALPPGGCVFPDGDLENLSHHVQAYLKLPTYQTPMLVGEGNGASLAYAVLAQTPASLFAGAVTLGFCPMLASTRPLCKGEGVHFAKPAAGAATLALLPAPRLPKPWIAIQGETAPACSAEQAQRFVAAVGADAAWVPGGAAKGTADEVAPLKAAYARLADGNAPTIPPPPSSLADLPLVEVPAEGSGSRFAVLLSGDGGWAGIDKELAAAFSAKGIPVAGFDSLRYFWSERTPEGLAADLDRIVRYYAARWNRREVILVGYSQGADVLPFALNRLPQRTRALVRLNALLSPGLNASFEFHVTNWLGPSGDKPIAPEARQLSAADTICVHGRDEKVSLCPGLAASQAQVITLPGSHHYDGNYERLAALILERVRR